MEDFGVELNIDRGPKQGANGSSVYPLNFNGGGTVPAGKPYAGSTTGLGGTGQITWDPTGDTASLTIRQWFLNLTKVREAASATPAQANPFVAAAALGTTPIQLSTEKIDSEPFNKPFQVPSAALRGDHYKCYQVVRSFTQRRVRQVLLRDQFGNVRGSTAQAVEVCNPVQKIYRNKTTRIRDTRRHLVAYRLTAPGQRPRNISAQNQFGNQRLTTGKLTTLLLPAQKEQLQGNFRKIPFRARARVLDHYACYQANRPANRLRSVVLADQFESRTNVIPRNRAINGFCNPTRKTYNKKTTNIRNPQAHLTSYRLTGRRKSGQRTVRVQTQFGRYRVITGNATRLLVPSAKRYCATFSARTNLPYVAANGQRFGSVTGVALTPYGGHPRGACPRT